MPVYILAGVGFYNGARIRLLRVHYMRWNIHAPEYSSIRLPPCVIGLHLVSDCHNSIGSTFILGDRNRRGSARRKIKGQRKHKIHRNEVSEPKVLARRLRPVSPQHLSRPVHGSRSHFQPQLFPRPLPLHSHSHSKSATTYQRPPTLPLLMRPSSFIITQLRPLQGDKIA